MRKDNKEFRSRFLRWKNGELVYENGRALPAYEEGTAPYINRLVDLVVDSTGMYNTARYNANEDLYEANKRYNVTVTGKKKEPYRWATARTPQLTMGDTMKGIDAATGPLLHWMQPSQYVGAVRDAVNGRNPLVSMLRGNSGVVSEEYAAEHPVLSTAFNLGTDAVIPTTLWAKNTTPVRNYRLSRAINKELDNVTKAPTVEWTKATKTPKITAENAASITPEQWTAAQDAAIARGDMAEAQRLRDLHFMAKASSPILDSSNKPIKTYHTVSKDYDPSFNHFDTNIEGFHTGIFTTDNPIMSGSYMDKVVSKNEQDAIIEAIRQRELHHYDNYVGDVFNNLKEDARKVYGNPKKARKEILKDFPFLKDIEEGRQKELYITLDNPLIIEGNNTGWYQIPISALPENMLSYPVVTPGAMNKVTSTRTIDKILGGYPETLPKVPYDGAVFKDIFDYGPNKFVSPEFNKVGNVYDVQNPNQVKLANAITYDKSGVRIPLGKRDNFKLNDIRYSWLAPFIGLGTLGSLYGNNNTNGFLIHPVINYRK